MFFYGVDFYIGLSLVRKMEASLCVPSRKVYYRSRGLRNSWKSGGGQRSEELLPRSRDVDLA